MFGLFLLLRLMDVGAAVCLQGVGSTRSHNGDAGMQPNRFWLGFTHPIHAKRFVRRLVARHFSRFLAMTLS